MRDREIVALHPHVGGAWAPSTDATTDLGVVRAADAAAYFISLAPKANDNSRLNPLLAAAIADSANVVQFHDNGRYSLLETLRQFGLDRAGPAGGRCSCGCGACPATSLA